MITRYKVKCAYDGTDYSGWQIQPNGRTIQGVIENRLEYVCQKAIRIHASGRTDAGVHARGQVFHFDTEWKHSQQDLRRALESGLPDSIQISAFNKANAHFHARFSAKRKRYMYQLNTKSASPMETRYTWSLNRPLNVSLMQEASNYLLGEHDFSAFCARRNDGSDESLNPVRQLYRLDVRKSGTNVKIITEANGYLYKMVRIITGALVEIGLMKRAPESLSVMLKNGQRLDTLQTAPAKGLSLDKVYYDTKGSPKIS